MKLKKEFITHDTEDGQLMICVGGDFNGMVRSNKAAGEIINLLMKETTRDAVVEAMLERYDADRAYIEDDVDRIIDALREIGAIDE